MFEIWFEWYDLRTLLFKCFGNLFENLENPCKAPLWFGKVLPKPYYDISWKPYTHMLLVLHWALSNCCDPSDKSFYAFMIKIHLLCFYEKLALYHPSIPQNKCSTNFVDLSLQLFLKKWGMGYQKKWTHEGQSIGKKEGPCRPLKKKNEWEKKEIAMLSEEFI